MVRIGCAGLGKMGLSHFAILNSHPEVEVCGVADPFGYLTATLNKYTGLPVFPSYEEMLEKGKPDAVLVATPSRFHEPMVREALQRGIHVFCEKPFCLSANHSEALAVLAGERGLVNQVGYHYRFVGAFQEVKRLIAAGAIGKVSHVMAEAYGPVVVRRKGTTWRIKNTEGGGCLYDYAAHPINLLNWYFSMPDAASGTMLKKTFSEETDDEVYSTLEWADGMTAQLSVNWSDESQRKMSTKLSIWGTEGRIVADRQECVTYLRSTKNAPDGYELGWNTRYTTDLTEGVWYYLRGEEYSAQIDYFVRQVQAGGRDNVNSFASAAMADRVIEMMLADHRGTTMITEAAGAPKKRAFGLFSRSAR